jgi:hypothetical protein
LIIVTLIVAGLALPATSSAAVRWPANCTTFRCVNAHLNQLHKQAKANAARDKQLRAVVQTIIDTTPPSNNVLQAEIDQLGGVNDDQWNAIGDINQRLGCWDTIPLTRYRGAAWGADAHKPFAFFGTNRDYNADWDGYFDFRHAGQPDNAYIYRVLINACTSGPAN